MVNEDVTPTIDELISEIEALHEERNTPPSIEDGWFTATDWARERDCSEQHVRDILKPMIEAGLIEKKRHRGNKIYYRLRNGHETD